MKDNFQHDFIYDNELIDLRKLKDIVVIVKINILIG